MWQEHGQHHEMRAPAVDVPDEPPGGNDEVDVLHRLIGEVRTRLVVDHQEDAGDREDDKGGGKDQPEAEGVGEPQRVTVDTDALQVEEEVVERALGALPVRLRYLAVAEHRFADMPRRLFQIVEELSGRRHWRHTWNRVPFGTCDSAFTCNWPSGDRTI